MFELSYKKMSLFYMTTYKYSNRLIAWGYNIKLSSDMRRYIINVGQNIHKMC